MDNPVDTVEKFWFSTDKPEIYKFRSKNVDEYFPVYSDRNAVFTVLRNHVRNGNQSEKTDEKLRFLKIPQSKSILVLTS